MTSKAMFISLTPDTARALVTELQAVLDGEASYFHAELVTDDGHSIGLHMSGPDDPDQLEGVGHE